LDTQYSLDEITRRLVQLAMEKRLRNTLAEVAGELPQEVLDEIYSKVFKPVMVLAMMKVMSVIGR